MLFRSAAATRSGWSPTLQESALPLALAVATIWVVHPLLTEAVTYVVQRAESMVGLFYLLTLYCFVRGAASRSSGVWYACSAIACLLGMATKEVMVSAPLMVLLYDRTFVAGSFREAWRQRWPVYAALASTWIVLGYIVMATASSGGYFAEAPWQSYLVTQLHAIVRYLRLAVWPDTLVFDYGSPLVGSVREVAPDALIIVLLLAGTAVSLWRWRALGFLGAWFFAILAPTSSVIPVAGQTVAERRMYLPLAAVIAVLVIGTYLLGRKLLKTQPKFGRVLGWGAAGTVALALTILTDRKSTRLNSSHER